MSKGKMFVISSSGVGKHVLKNRCWTGRGRLKFSVSAHPPAPDPGRWTGTLLLSDQGAVRGDDRKMRFWNTTPTRAITTAPPAPGEEKISMTAASGHRTHVRDTQVKQSRPDAVAESLSSPPSREELEAVCAAGGIPSEEQNQNASWNGRPGKWSSERLVRLHRGQRRTAKRSRRRNSDNHCQSGCLNILLLLLEGTKLRL